MVKKFELSAYGVEEMNQKELVDVEGGAFMACILLGLVLIIAALVVVSGGGIVTPDGKRVVSTNRFDPETGLPIYVADAGALLDM